MTNKFDSVNDAIRVNTEEYSDGKKMNSKRFWREHERHQWMCALFLGSTTLYLARAIMPICSIQISEEMKWDRKKAGTILGSFFWGYMMTPFLGGYLADLIGGESVVTAAAFGWSITTILFPFLPGLSYNIEMIYPIFILARVALGFFQGFHYASVGSLMAQRVLVTQRQFTFSFQSSGAHLGTLLCGSIGSYLNESVGWKVPFLICGILGLIWTIVTRYMLLQRHDRIIAYSFTLPESRTAEPSEPIPWKKLLSNPAFWAMLVGHFVHGNSFYILLSWIPSYFHDNYPHATSWVFNVVPWIVTIPAVLLSGLLGDKMLHNAWSTTTVRKLMTTVSLLGAAFFLSLLSMCNNYYSALICMACAICCCGFHNSGISVNPQDLAPKFGGTVFGIMNMVGAIPGFLGVYMAGYILETTKSWSMVFNQTSGICVVGWLIYMIFGTAKQII